MNDKLQTRQKMLSSWKGIVEVLQKEMITAEDFTKAFAVVVNLIKELKSSNLNEFSSMKKEMSAMSDKLISDFETVIKDTKQANETTFQKIKERSMESIDTMFRKMDVQGKMDEMYKEHEAMMQKMEGAMPDKEAMMKEMMAKMPEHTAEEMRDKLENLQDGEKLSVQAIEGLSKLLEELKVKSSRVVSGGLISKRIRFVDDETPSGSGTAFTISRDPEVGSFKLYRGGARQRVTEDYTLSGRNLTLNVALVPGEILLCDFRH